MAPTVESRNQIAVDDMGDFVVRRGREKRRVPTKDGIVVL